MDEIAGRAVAARRKAEALDAEFLVRLFRESHQSLMAALGAAAEPLIEMQYRGRAMTYAAQFPAAENLILLDEDGQPVGRLLLDRQPSRWRIVDVAVLAAQRGRGLGTFVLSECQRQAQAVGARLELRVEQHNPARRLYERLGFKVAGQDAVAIEMVWSATDQA